jgi:hypothetical protein
MLHGLVRRFYPVPYNWKAVLVLSAWAAALFAVWQYVPGVKVWWAEIALLGAYLAGVLGLRVVSLRTIRTLLRR